MKRRCSAILCVLAVSVLPGCNKSAEGPSEQFDLSTSPQYVNRIIPGHRPLGLVNVGGSGEAHLVGTASIADTSVTFVPTAVPAGSVAEVWVDLPDTTTDVPFTVEVRNQSGHATPVTFSATLVPGVDDVADTAEQIVSVFLTRIGDEVAGLPAAATDLTNGTPVAGLLVVTHYAWFTDAYEIGLAWHIMVAPDDFAELYLRPRDSLVPTVAYRINSWSTALAGGDYTFTKVDPPTEVTR